MHFHLAHSDLPPLEIRFLEIRNPPSEIHFAYF